MLSKIWRSFRNWIERRCEEAEEFCPNCGYYCTGKTIFCTKHPDKQKGKS